MKWRHWLHGLVAAAIGGSCSAITAGIVDPATFNLETAGGWKKVLLMVGVSGIVSAAAYLKQSPIPPEEEDTKQ